MKQLPAAHDSSTSSGHSNSSPHAAPVDSQHTHSAAVDGLQHGAQHDVDLFERLQTPDANPNSATLFFRHLRLQHCDGQQAMLLEAVAVPAWPGTLRLLDDYGLANSGSGSSATNGRQARARTETRHLAAGTSTAQNDGGDGNSASVCALLQPGEQYTLSVALDISSRHGDRCAACTIACHRDGLLQTGIAQWFPIQQKNPLLCTLML